MIGSWPSPEVAELAEWIRARTGLTFPTGRREPAAASLVIALGEEGSVAKTVSRLERDHVALDELLAELTIGETYFFRHPEQFEVIRACILPQLLGDQRAPLRVWSAGCATGEEPYSLAILLREAAAPIGKIIGSDLSRARLAVARRGRYRKWSLRGVPTETIARYFQSAGTWYQLSPEIRAAVEFRYLNLVEDQYPSATAGIWGMDLILCRNVLIYLDRSAVARVARKLVASLSDHGWLFLGASDPSIADLAPVEVTVTEAGLAYRRIGAETSHPAGPMIEPARAVPPPREVPIVEAPRPWAEVLITPSPPPAHSPGTEGTGEDNDSPLTPDQLQRLYWEQRYDAVAAGSARLLNEGRHSERVHVLLVRSLANQGDTTAAGHATVAALETHPESAELLYLHSVLLLEAKRAEEAVVAAKRALYLDSSLVVAHLAFADASIRIGDPVEARRALRNAERILSRSSPDEIVAASDGETVARMLRIVQFRLRLLQEKVASNG
jgi:chemotaxis protein methyltransferase CheR